MWLLHMVNRDQPIIIQVSRENAYSNTTSNNAEDLCFAKQLQRPTANSWPDANPLEMGWLLEKSIKDIE